VPAEPGPIGPVVSRPTDPGPRHENRPRPGGFIRPATRTDLPAVAALCAAHAAFERADPPPADLAARLAPKLFSTSPRAWCAVADFHGSLVGYATCSLEFSTWYAAEYLHLDCLFVSAENRGQGWGQRLFAATSEIATRLGAAHLEWQTPAWNTEAARFYHRTGAVHQEKLRYRLPTTTYPITPGPPPPPFSETAFLPGFPGQ
jgi:GNAT superfamily N-acetyltransferase